MSLLVPKKALLLAAGGVGGGLDPNSVFQNRLRTGSAATRNETPGFRPDLVWIKRRDATGSHYLFDTDRGALSEMNTDTTDAAASLASSLTSFNTDGYSLGTNTGVNASGGTFVDWLFKEAPGFFKKGSFTKAASTAVTVDLSSLGVVGAVLVKAASTTSNWYFWHRKLTAGNNLVFNATTGQSTTAAYVSVSGTTMTFDAAAPAATYEYYAFAHQPTGIIQCDGYEAVSGTNTINLGWDVQWLLVVGSGIASNRTIYDTARGLTASAAQVLLGNTTAADSASSAIRAAPNGYTDTQSQTASRIFMAIKKGAG